MLLVPVGKKQNNTIVKTFSSLLYSLSNKQKSRCGVKAQISHDSFKKRAKTVRAMSIRHFRYFSIKLVLTGLSEILFQSRIKKIKIGYTRKNLSTLTSINLHRLLMWWAIERKESLSSQATLKVVCFLFTTNKSIEVWIGAKVEHKHE